MPLDQSHAPVFVFWNYPSVVLAAEQMGTLIDKIRERTSARFNVEFYCDSRTTDEKVIVEAEKLINGAVRHVTATKIVTRICSDMCHAALFCDEPGWLVLISNSDNYGPTLTSISRAGWKVMIVHSDASDVTFLDYADESSLMRELLELAPELPDVLETRCFLLQIPKPLMIEEFASLLGDDQQCVYVNAVSREAVVVVQEAENDCVQKSLELLIGRICAATGAQPRDVLPFSAQAFPPCVRGPSGPATLHSHHLLVTMPPSLIPFGAPLLPTTVYLNPPLKHKPSARAASDFGPPPAPARACNQRSEEVGHEHRRGVKRSLVECNTLQAPKSFESHAAALTADSDGVENAGEARVLDEGPRVSPFGDNPWKTAEERFKRRAWQEQQERLHGLHGVDEFGGGESRDRHRPAGGESLLPAVNGGPAAFEPAFEARGPAPRQGPGGRERFRKPAPQCVYWENRRHRQETGCTLWHPRETCRFFPTCAHQAEECGFAHPFCGAKCQCAPHKRNPQLNHWTMEMQRLFPQQQQQQKSSTSSPTAAAAA